MLPFTAVIQQFQENGDKTRWTYIEIPIDITEQMQPGSKRSFRVKGHLDDYQFSGTSLIPIGQGRFIMALNAAARKGIGKNKGASVQVKMQPDTKQMETPDYIQECLEDEPKAKAFFLQLAKSHQRYFINWIGSAKTDLTKTKRLAQAVTALSNGQDFGQMMRENKRIS